MVISKSISSRKNDFIKIGQCFLYKAFSPARINGLNMTKIQVIMFDLNSTMRSSLIDLLLC